MKNKCGTCHTCCEWFLVTLTDVPDDAVEFFETWGAIVEKTGDCSLLKIYSPCKHLKKDGCDIYSKRPQFCKDYNCK